MSDFLKAYFFEPLICIERTENFVIGNQKGSAVKLLILFNELILNAVKYSAFVNKDQRFVRIQILHDSQEILVLVENRFNPKKKVKTSGLGHSIINNFAKLLNTSPVIKKENEIYSVKIVFENFWKEGKLNENSLCGR
jgi:two-component sensor histidine kinase